MAGRNRADSVHNKTQNFVEEDLAPPAHLKLRKADLPYWQAIVRARARNTWNVVDLQHAANLARCQCDIERIQKEIAKEGDTLVNDRGTKVLNPKHALLETLTRRSIALSKHIQVHAIATVGESKQSRAKNTAQKGAQDAIQKTKESDDLLARPS